MNGEQSERMVRDILKGLHRAQRKRDDGHEWLDRNMKMMDAFASLLDAAEKRRKSDDGQEGDDGV